MKRILCVLLTLALLVAGIPARAMAASGGGKLIAFTFDDGPADSTARLLDGLDKLGAKVTFFTVGNRVSSWSGTIERAYLAGHQIGCHSWDHEELTGLSDSAVLAEFSKSYEALDKICGKGTRYLTRAPYGSASDRVRRLVDTPFVYWSVDPRDWESRNSDKVRERILSNAADGSIVLVHDLYGTSVTGALEAMEILKKQGYEFVTVSELFRRRGVTMENRETYYSCKNTGKDLGPVKAPTITYAADEKGLLVTIQAQSGAKIYYNTNGAPFKQGSTAYTGPFYAKPGTKISAIAAFDLNGARSTVTTATVSKVACKTPQLTIRDGVMTASCGTKGAKIFYTTNFTDATTGSTRYGGPVNLKPGTVVSVVAGGEAFVTSGQRRLYYSELGNVFSDVFPYHWFCRTMDRAAEEGILYGKGGYEYAPREEISRGEFVTMLYRLAGSPDVSGLEYPFLDVPAGKYYADPVKWAYANGIMKGFSEEAFRPGWGISREQIGKTLSEYLRSLEITVPGAEGACDDFPDREDIAPYAKAGMEAMVAAGIFKGSAEGSLLPRDGATRAEGIAFLVRMEDYIDSYVPPVPEPTEAPTDPTEEPTDPTGETVEPAEEVPDSAETTR